MTNKAIYVSPMQETYIRFAPVRDVVAPCAYIVLCTEPGGHTVRLSFSNIRGASARDLLVRFDSVMACMSHTEFAHPWEATPTAEIPRLEGRWDGYAFPLLEVKNSQWLASFTDFQTIGLARSMPRHFRFVSLDNVVDLLMYGDGAVTAEWIVATPQNAP
ncbi:hypothetical protein ABL841_18280 [Variovorax paradoxus]|jgi:hypothetical protein|uniref:hypothetical protein n=2 Tax=Variovorax paradoxus TaxID=34073 RepID=UPI000363EE26